MGPASYPAIVLSLLLAFFMSTSGAWDGLQLSRRSDATVTAPVMARHTSPLALAGAYSFGGSSLHVRFEVESYSAALVTLAVDAEVLGICVGFAHDASGFSASSDLGEVLSSLVNVAASSVLPRT